jgi:branched-chain amino acid transport system substrate-binding protein
MPSAGLAAGAAEGPRHRLVETTAATSGLVKQLPPEISEGVLSTSYLKDPNLDEFKSDPAIKLYQEIIEKYYGLGLDLTVQPIGPTEGELFVKLLSGLKQVTRADIIKAARSLDNVEISYLQPGIRLNTSATDGFPIKQMQVIQFNEGAFRRVGDVVSAPPL